MIGREVYILFGGGFVYFSNDVEVILELIFELKVKVLLFLVDVIRRSGLR